MFDALRLIYVRHGSMVLDKSPEELRPLALSTPSKRITLPSVVLRITYYKVHCRSSWGISFYVLR